VEQWGKKYQWKHLQPCVEPAAISSKFTGFAGDMAVTDLVVLWFGWDKKSATTFFNTGKYNNCTLNSEMNARWRCCLGEMGAETL
jgi:hypothetical protein